MARDDEAAMERGRRRAQRAAVVQCSLVRRYRLRTRESHEGGSTLGGTVFGVWKQGSRDGMVAREDGQGGVIFYRAWVKGGGRSGEQVIVSDYIFNSTQFEIEYRGGEPTGWHHFDGGEEAVLAS
jgi:hypothetical protein